MSRLFMTILTILSIAAASTFVTAAEKKLSDAEITHILNETNKGEIDIAKLAKKKATNDEVKNFAEMMITEHSTNNKNSMQLVRKLNLRPVNNEKSKEIEQEGEKVLSKLKEIEGKDFDLAYINAQVNRHQQVLDNLENSLIPAARNPEIKALLDRTKSSAADHLEYAKKIQSILQ